MDYEALLRVSRVRGVFTHDFEFTSLDSLLDEAIKNDNESTFEMVAYEFFGGEVKITILIMR